MADIGDRRDTGRMSWGAALIGFALGGFFDGILLHQILQWHHLLSAVGGDLRFQVLFDGYFHAAMYVIALIGAGLLLSGRAALAASNERLPVLAYAAIGFGVWHVIDAVLSHWLLGIHRIRMDSEVPLFWDVLWLALFGLIPLWLGWRSLRPGGGSGTGRAQASLATLLVTLIAAAALLAFPIQRSEFAVVVFPAGTQHADALAAIVLARGLPVASDPSGTVWTVTALGNDGVSALGLYAKGALLVSGAGWMPGCASWSRNLAGAMSPTPAAFGSR